MNRSQRRTHRKRKQLRAKRLAKAMHLYQDKGRDTRVTRMCRCAWCAPHREFDGLTLQERRACDAAWSQIEDGELVKRMALELNPPPPEDPWLIFDEFIHGAALQVAYTKLLERKR